MNISSLVRIAGTAVLDGIHTADAESAGAALGVLANTTERQIGLSYGMGDLLVNLGRPREAAPYYERLKQASPGEGVSAPIYDALYAGGDTVLAAEAAREALPLVSGPLSADTPRRKAQLEATCGVAAWKAARHDTAGLDQLFAQLDRPGLPPAEAQMTEGMQACARVIRALLYIRQRPEEARATAITLDTAAIHEDNHLAKLVASRILEQLGDTTRALAVLRHRSYHWATTFFLAALLREEGRLAALTGDREGAIRAYQHYLRLRSKAEPRLQPEVAMVREELGKLVGEQ
jgi:tetratricopeptide (TPR) repeat protein